VTPLLHPGLALSTQLHAPHGKEVGHVTILFIDLRGSTRWAEAIDRAGGHYSNLTGDGLMALFGLEVSTDYRARAALICRCKCWKNSTS
jgi:class 3 adenylate cyclase